MPRVLRPFALVLLLSPAARADPVWSCRVEPDPHVQMRVACIDISSPTGAAGRPGEPAEPGEEAPGVMGWVVPLYDAPFDLADVERLVRATLCRGAPCTVILAQKP